MREIGGYFELEYFYGKEYHSGAVGINTARNALLYLMGVNKISKIYIPCLICDSIELMLKRNLYEFEYYHIKDDFLPDFEKKLNENEYLYVVNYYGLLSNKTICELKEKYKNIIVDNVQAFFQKPVADIDTIYSCRKFFGVPDGAYLYTKRQFQERFTKDMSASRFTHLLGRFECRASVFYENFKKIDEKFIEEDLKIMSELTSNLLRAIDYERVENKRTQNFRYLNQHLEELNQLQLFTPSGAFCYPLYIGDVYNNSNRLKQELARKNIYIPTYWPNVLQQMPESSIEYKFANGILALPCDQRYSIEEMDYILDCLKIVLDLLYKM